MTRAKAKHIWQHSGYALSELVLDGHMDMVLRGGSPFGHLDEDEDAIADVWMQTEPGGWRYFPRD